MSFSIKFKGLKEDRPLERKSALPVESSDSENEAERLPQKTTLPQRLIDADRITVSSQRRGELERRDIPRGEARGDDMEGERSWGDYPGHPPFNPAFRGRSLGEGSEPPREGYYREGYREPPPYRELPSVGYREYPDPYTEQGLARPKAGFDRGRMTEEESEMKQGM